MARREPNIFLKYNLSTPLPLEQLMLTKAAIHICHSRNLRKHLLCKSNHRYGAYCKLDNMHFIKACLDSIEKQSVIICKDLKLPNALEGKLILRIVSIAEHMLQWRDKWQYLIKKPFNFIDQFLETSDWTAEARINDIKIAERLVQDERLDLYNRFAIASIYCLKPTIVSLFHQIRSNPENRVLPSLSRLPSLWYYFLKSERARYEYFCRSAFTAAIEEGEWVAFLYCWRNSTDTIKQNLVARASNFIPENFCLIKFLNKRACERLLPLTGDKAILYFLLSQMNIEQRISFFRNILCCQKYLLKIFLDWSAQMFLIPLIPNMWGMMPNDTFGDIFLKLVEKCANANEHEGYDYDDVLVELFKDLPDSLKRNLFKTHCQNQDHSHCVAAQMILTLAKNQPLRIKDVRIIDTILEEATPDEKQSIIISNLGTQICESLIINGNVELCNWVLAQCLPGPQTVSFKKHYFLSKSAIHTHFSLLKQGKADQAKLFCEWGSLSEKEVSKFHLELFLDREFQNLYRRLIPDFQVHIMDRILKLCLPSKGEQAVYKRELIRRSGWEFCFDFIKEAKWEQLSQFLIWCLATKENEEQLRKEFRRYAAVEIHYKLMCQDRWHDAQQLFKWLKLSSDEIKALKKETILFVPSLCNFHSMLLHKDGRNKLRNILKWCCSDKETVLAFKKLMISRYSQREAEIYYNVQCIQRNANKLVKERLSDFTKEQKLSEERMVEKEEQEERKCPKEGT